MSYVTNPLGFPNGLVVTEAPKPAASSTPPKPGKHPSGATHLFIVDDRDTVRDIIKFDIPTIPSLQNLQIIECANGEIFLENLANLEENEKALVILDQEMPRLKGTDALKRLVQSYQSKRIAGLFFNSSTLTPEQTLWVQSWASTNGIPIAFHNSVSSKTPPKEIAEFFDSEAVAGKSVGATLAAAVPKS